MKKSSKKVAVELRSGSKQEAAINALKKSKKGLTLAALSKVVKQQPITVRSLISVLRTKGFKIRALGEQTFAL